MGKKVQSHSDQYTSHWPCFKTDTLPTMEKQGRPKPMKKETIARINAYLSLASHAALYTRKLEE